MAFIARRLIIIPKLTDLLSPMVTRIPFFTHLIPQTSLPTELSGPAILQMNRNARTPKQANHGARPCSSVMRRLKKKGVYRKLREEVIQEPDEFNIRDLHELDEEEAGKS